METEWMVVCARGHRFYQRVRDVPPEDTQFPDCPTCGAPRRGEIIS